MLQRYEQKLIRVCGAFSKRDMQYYVALHAKVENELALLRPQLKRQEDTLSKLSSKLTSVQLAVYRSKAQDKACFPYPLTFKFFLLYVGAAYSPICFCLNKAEPLTIQGSNITAMPRASA